MTITGYLRAWWRDERGQDLVEYTLLLAFVVLNAAALLLFNVETVASIWDAATDALVQATEKGL
jgi:Flp pilus assembly pilin Flp